MVTEREQREAEGVALMVAGIRQISEANAGNIEEVRRAIAGAISSYMFHIAGLRTGTDPGPMRWLLKLASDIKGMFERCEVNDRKRQAAHPQPRLMQ